MSLSKNLTRERTNVSVKTPTTFNASGNYKPKYGKAKYAVGGRSTLGTAASGGNIAGYNPPSLSGRGNSYGETFGSYNIDTGPPGSDYNTGGGGASAYFTSYWSHGGYSSYNETYIVDNKDNWTGTVVPAPYSNNFGYSDSNGSNSGYANIDYNVTSSTPGNANYNPYSPATTGNTFTIFGVTFPGGTGGFGNTITPVYAKVDYTTAGTPITITNGARVDIVVG